MLRVMCVSVDVYLGKRLVLPLWTNKELGGMSFLVGWDDGERVASVQ